jgi:vacuolar protein sorting-associated protein 13A/C
MNLGNQPVEILVEDVYLLVIPSPQTSTNPQEDEARAQAAKAERLENAELLNVQAGNPESKLTFPNVHSYCVFTTQ